LITSFLYRGGSSSENTKVDDTGRGGKKKDEEGKNEGQLSTHRVPQNGQTRSERSHLCHDLWGKGKSNQGFRYLHPNRLCVQTCAREGRSEEGRPNKEGKRKRGHATRPLPRMWRSKGQKSDLSGKGGKQDWGHTIGGKNSKKERSEGEGVIIICGPPRAKGS